MRLPLVSVIVPVFNGASYLRESLDSILNQTYPALEVLVMDDASFDATADIAASYGDRIRYHRQACNRGIYGNANDGIAMARGEYLAIYHADDVYLPTMVEREVAFLTRHPEVGAVFTSMVMIDPAGVEEGALVLPGPVRGSRSLSYEEVLNTLLLYRNRFLMCPSSMVRASVYRDVGGYRDTEFKNTSDMDMWLRIARQHSIGVLEDRLFKYRYGHGNSAQRYHTTRIDPDRYFAIVDRHLREGGMAIATPDAIRAHEAHRVEDSLMRAIKAYILKRPDECRRILGEVSVHRLIGSPRVQRWRLLGIFAALQLLARLPSIPVAVKLMAWRWLGAGRRKRGTARVTVGTS